MADQLWAPTAAACAPDGSSANAKTHKARNLLVIQSLLLGDLTDGSTIVACANRPKRHLHSAIDRYWFNVEARRTRLRTCAPRSQQGSSDWGRCARSGRALGAPIQAPSTP